MSGLDNTELNKTHPAGELTLEPLQNKKVGCWVSYTLWNSLHVLTTADHFNISVVRLSLVK